MFTWLINMGMTKWFFFVLKGDNIVRHQMGLYWMHPEECVLHSTCPRACTSQYTPMGLYWLIQALGHVLLNTHFWVSSLRKTESVLENILGKVRGTWRVKIEYITFKNWIMGNTVHQSFSIVYVSNQLVNIFLAGTNSSNQINQLSKQKLSLHSK